MMYRARVTRFYDFLRSVDDVFHFRFLKDGCDYYVDFDDPHLRCLFYLLNDLSAHSLQCVSEFVSKVRMHDLSMPDGDGRLV